MLVVAALLVPACATEVSLSDYAAQVEAHVATMNSRIDELDAELEGTQDDLALTQWYATERVAARRAFLDGFAALDPPEAAVDLHNAALDVMGRLTEAEALLAERVLAMESLADVDDIWETPEGIAARAADQDAIALCEAAEQQLDTGERLDSGDSVWVPAELKEVIQVAFGCHAESRQG